MGKTGNRPGKIDILPRNLYPQRDGVLGVEISEIGIDNASRSIEELAGITAMETEITAIDWDDFDDLLAFNNADQAIRAKLLEMKKELEKSPSVTNAQAPYEILAELLEKRTRNIKLFFQAEDDMTKLERIDPKTARHKQAVHTVTTALKMLQKLNADPRYARRHATTS